MGHKIIQKSQGGKNSNSKYRSTGHDGPCANGLDFIVVSKIKEVVAREQRHQSLNQPHSSGIVINGAGV